MSAAESLAERKVSDVMSKALVAADPETTIFQIAKIMEQSGVGAVLVKKDGKPAGIITDRDYAIKIIVKSVSTDAPVEQVATFPLITINSDESILVAAEKMVSNKIRKLAVADNGKVVGIVTSTDLIKEISKK